MEHGRFLGNESILYDIMLMDMCHGLSKPIAYTIPGVNTNTNSGLGLILLCQYRFNCNKGWELHSGGDCTLVGTGPTLGDCE